MNLELVESRTSRIIEIYLNNDRSVPSFFRMREILQINPKRRKFGEYVDIYKRCNGGYS